MDKPTEWRFQLCARQFRLMENRIQFLEDELKKLNEIVVNLSARSGHELIPHMLVGTNE